MKPKHEPEVVELKRYRKVREKAAPKPPPTTKAPRPRSRAGRGESFLGDRPHAGVILAVVAAVLVVLMLLG